MLQNSGKIRTLCKLARNLRLGRQRGVLCSAENVIPCCFQTRGKKDDSSNLSSLFVPVQIKPTPDDINVGAELTGTLNKADLLKVLNKFYTKKEIKHLLQENGLDRKSKSYCIYSFLN